MNSFKPFSLSLPSSSSLPLPNKGATQNPLVSNPIGVKGAATPPSPEREQAGKQPAIVPGGFRGGSSTFPKSFEKKGLGKNPAFKPNNFSKDGAKNSKGSYPQKGKNGFLSTTVIKPRVLSISQLLARLRLQRQKKQDQQKRGGLKRNIKPIIPPKSLIIILKEKPEKAIYNRRIIDYKHCGLLQRYIGLGGKILPRRQTRLSAKQQRYVAKTIKSARVMALLPFVSKEKGFFR